MANTVEKVILIFGREQVGNKIWWPMNSTGKMKQGKSILLGYYQREGEIQKELQRNLS